MDGGDQNVYWVKVAFSQYIFHQTLSRFLSAQFQPSLPPTPVCKLSKLYTKTSRNFLRGFLSPGLIIVILRYFFTVFSNKTDDKIEGKNYAITGKNTL